jgi:MFS family permease
MLAISIPAVVYSDKIGRRNSIIFGGLILSFSMLIIGSLYATNQVHTTGPARWVVVVLIFVFSLTFCFTWAIAGKIYASEIQPARTRASANCLAQGLSFFTNWLVAFATPVFLSKSAFGAYFLFGFLTLGTVMVLSIYMPETQGRSLEDIQTAFHQGPAVKNWMSQIRRLFSRAGISPPVSSGSSEREGSTSGIELSSMASEERGQRAVIVG